MLWFAMLVMVLSERVIPQTDVWVRRVLLQGIPGLPWGYVIRIVLEVIRPPLCVYGCVDGRASLGVIPGARPMAEPGD